MIRGGTFMKKRYRILGIAAAGALILSGCTKGTGAQTENSAESTATALSSEETTQAETEPEPDVTSTQAVTEGDADTQETSAQETSKEVPKGQYLSEITGEPIDESLKEQRPIAVMVDNESKALPHYGTADADVVYELMNSTANGRITRLMCIVKDWENISQLGSIRSTRPTNLLLMSEWNAVLCHDGGPYYNNQYFVRPWADHFSGTFSRVNNGKDREFTEYILPGDLDRNFKTSGYSTKYNKYRPDDTSHFNFVPWGEQLQLDQEYDTYLPCREIDLPFPHNQSRLVYNEKTQSYDYYEYGKIHKDAETGKVLTFTNVILQDCTFNQLDANGYLIYNCIDAAGNRKGFNCPGFYCTGGEAKDISWAKTSETDITRYYDSNGDEIRINTGRTYIGLVPADSWDDVVMK